MLLPETLKLHNQRNFEFHYIYFLPWKDQMVNDLIQAGGIVKCYSASNNIQLILQYKKVQEYVYTHGIDIVHAHLPWAGFLSRLLSYKIKIPVLYTEHNKQERYHKITFWLNKLSFNFQNIAIAVSNDVSSSIIQHIRPEISVKTVLNGVNTEYFQRDIQSGLNIRKKYGIPDKALVVGTVSVFRFQKRLHEWMKVFSNATRDNDQLFGIIVGDGPLKEELLELRKELRLEDRLLMPGLQTNTRDWYSAMDIFMMTSVFEGLPIALLEAMSMGCSIACTNAGGIREVIINGKSGIMVDVEEWQELIHSLHSLNDQNLRVRLSINARKRVIEAFSLQRMVSELENCYLEAKEGVGT
ncbi:glycosyltransferase family 4 protein [Fulvivirga sp. 29W222]|uniref:Glycosyltransferase family 4 protein n=1 Tax=Fulvivirga marina TaxID=2494733 RepID=A0A937KC20_9BACT|nr:glycosyltransferase family 4 protein [Fulvivirga marina]MBL6444768.1 glycosyltransferase family 4 protein [Fulvivirga marina]